MSTKRKAVLLVGVGALVLVAIYMLMTPDATVVATAIFFTSAVLAVWASGRSSR
jgi:hypothetical protein